MKMLKNIGLSLLGILALHNIAKAQVTEQDIRHIDSLYAHQYLQSPVIHDNNVHSTASGPVMTWDLGNGLHVGIPNYAVAWSNTNRVDQGTANSINSVEGQSYKLFDLNGISTIQAYEDSLVNYLENIGINVGLKPDHKNIESKLFPNPATDRTNYSVNMEAGEKYNLNIIDLQGRLVEQYDGVTNSKGLNLDLNLQQYNRGIYILQLNTKNGSISTKMVIR